MKNLINAVWVEILKARRSKVPLITLLGFGIAPLAGGFFMVILKDPEMAKSMGMISTKAQIVAGTADWPTYFGMLSQAVSIGGLILFAFVASWVFGREYSDRTIRDILALPTPRRTIIFAKFILILIWSSILVVAVYLIGMGVGALIDLPPTEKMVFTAGTLNFLISALLTIMLATPVAFFASYGHGYLSPMGFAIFTVIFAQIVAATGWGEFFPWSIPALYSGVAGAAYAELGFVSFMLVILTSVIGVLATFIWWDVADQTY
jgi:ABC-2 type transport system permease protein